MDILTELGIKDRKSFERQFKADQKRLRERFGSKGQEKERREADTEALLASGYFGEVREPLFEYATRAQANAGPARGATPAAAPTAAACPKCGRRLLVPGWQAHPGCSWSR